MVACSYMLRILCTIALAGIAFHYTICKIPHMFQKGDDVVSYLRGTMDSPRQARRLVDTNDSYGCSCNCRIQAADDKEGWAMISLDHELIATLGGDPTLCVLKHQSSRLLKSGMGKCDDLCGNQVNSIHSNATEDTTNATDDGYE